MATDQLINKTQGDAIIAGLTAIKNAINDQPVPTQVEDVVADAFDVGVSYVPGDYCIYNNKLYKCDTAHHGAWDGNDFTLTTVAAELDSVNEALSFKQFGNYVAGTSSININTLDYKELLFVLTYEQSTNCSIMTANTLKEIVQAKSAFNVLTLVGYGLTGTVGGVGFQIINGIVTLNFAYVGNTDVKSFTNTKFGIYYR